VTSPDVVRGRQTSHRNEQGSKFTSRNPFMGVLAGNDIVISMDGKGAWRVGRLWRSVK
jgi:hypothetical protein